MAILVESALVVLVPEAETLVESFRLRYDPSAALGVPAHITVLYPFKPLSELTANDREKLTGLFKNLTAFTTVFTETRRFPAALYLAPTPEEPFRRLTEAVAKEFHETPPYGGQFPDVIPHLTVAQTSNPQDLREIAADFKRVAKDGLPIRMHVTEVALMDNADGIWQVRQRFGLGVGDEAS